MWLVSVAFGAAQGALPVAKRRVFGRPARRRLWDMYWRLWAARKSGWMTQTFFDYMAAPVVASLSADEQARIARAMKNK